MVAADPSLLALLNPRQLRLYTFVASLYKPVPLAHPSGGDLEAPDAGVSLGTAAFTGVPCFYKSTPEIDVAGSDAGRGKELNIFTLDEWHFGASQAIADQWVIVLTGSDPAQPPHPYIGRVWVVRDNPQIVAAQGRRRANFQMVYAVLSNVPGLSGHVSGLD